MSPDDLQIIRQQVPEVSDAQIQATYEACQKDVIETICTLLELPNKKDSAKTEWDKRREICDSYDEEMQKMMKGMRLTTEPLNH